MRIPAALAYSDTQAACIASVLICKDGYRVGDSIGHHIGISGLLCECFGQIGEVNLIEPQKLPIGVIAADQHGNTILMSAWHHKNRRNIVSAIDNAICNLAERGQFAILSNKT